MIRYSPATHDDVDALYPRLRAADLREVRAVVGEGLVKEAMHRSVSRSEKARVALDAALRPVALFGWGPGVGGAGVIWMVGTDEMPRYRRELLHHGRAFVLEALRQYPKLYNYVHAENAASIRWLRRLGFTVDPAAVPLGIHGAPFHYFHQDRHVS